MEWRSPDYWEPDNEEREGYLWGKKMEYSRILNEFGMDTPQEQYFLKENDDDSEVLRIAGRLRAIYIQKNVEADQQTH